MIIKYNDFLLEKEFNEIVNDVYRILESNGVWTSPNTVEWDLTSKEEEPKYPVIDKTLDKIKKFISKLDGEQIRKYYIKLVNGLKELPQKMRTFFLRHYTSVFLSFVSLSYLIGSGDDTKLVNQATKTEIIDPKIVYEISQLDLDKSTENSGTKVVKQEDEKFASFEEAQASVKEVEAGYSDDRKDIGNWLDVPGGKRFVGTNHGISAPILKEYLGRIPTRQDMENLSYETAIEIYKKDYWEAQNLGLFKNQSVANIIYDGCVNQGVEGTNKVIKNAANELGVELTGSVYSKSNIDKINKLNQNKLFKLIKKYREIRYKKAKTWHIHGDGWLNRLAGIEYQKDNNQS